MEKGKKNSRETRTLRTFLPFRVLSSLSQSSPSLNLLSLSLLLLRFEPNCSGNRFPSSLPLLNHSFLSNFSLFHPHTFIFLASCRSLQVSESKLLLLGYKEVRGRKSVATTVLPSSQFVRSSFPTSSSYIFLLLPASSFFLHSIHSVTLLYLVTVCLPVFVSLKFDSSFSKVQPIFLVRKQDKKEKWGEGGREEENREERREQEREEEKFQIPPSWFLHFRAFSFS